VKPLTQPEEVKAELVKLVKSGDSILSAKHSHGHRSVGDLVESHCALLAKSHFAGRYLPARGPRSTEDFTVTDGQSKVHVDVKSHLIRSAAGFSMPNLISISKLRSLLSDDSVSLLFLLVDYERLSSGSVKIIRATGAFVWEFSWEMLRIGSLGLGQLQIKNANQPMIFTSIGREKWLGELTVNAAAFYKSQMDKMSCELQKWVSPSDL